MARKASMHAVLEIGTRFGKLITIGNPFQVRGGIKGVTWDVNVRCDCGTEKTARVWQLKLGKSKSCGCHRKDMHSRVAFTKGFRVARPD